MSADDRQLRDPASVATGQKRSHPNALELGPRKRPLVFPSSRYELELIFASTTQDPLVHHGRHFGRAVHTFCNIQTLITNGLVMMGDRSDEDPESVTAQ